MKSCCSEKPENSWDVTTRMYIRLSRPKETPASCHMVDLDDEKDLNDTSEKPHEYGRCSRSEFVA